MKSSRKCSANSARIRPARFRLRCLRQQSIEFASEIAKFFLRQEKQPLAQMSFIHDPHDRIKEREALLRADEFPRASADATKFSGGS